MSTHILVTGSTGFIGSGVIQRLSQDATYTVSAVVRRSASQPEGVRQILVPDLVGYPLAGMFTGVNVVIHTAACVHVSAGRSEDLVEKYQRVNVQATIELAKQAATEGVRRFIFISSIGVNGGQTFDSAYTEEDKAHPTDFYTRSKWEAEQALREVGATTGMEIVILRPPLVYGPGAPGNFGRLVVLMQRGFWLPLGAVRNRRTLVSLNNLVDFIVVCVCHPAAANELFLVADDQDISTSTLLRIVAQALGKRPRLIPIPVSILRIFSSLIGKSNVFEKVCTDLRIDVTKARRLLGWTPPSNIYAEMKLLKK